MANFIQALARSDDQLCKIATIVEKLALSGHRLPVSLRMEILCDQLSSYNDGFLGFIPIDNEGIPALDILQCIYDKIGLYAFVIP
jgi:hypothetical protein